MDIRQLKYFVGIAEAGSLTEASRRLHIVQPALSQRLGDLERELGVKLVVRGRVGTALTPAGTELYERAKRILQQTDYAAAATREKAGVVEGTLSIGLLRSLSPLLSARLFGAIREAMPRVQPQIRVGYSAELERLLHKGELDMATLVSSTAGEGARGAAFSERLSLVGSRELLRGLPRRLLLKDALAVDLLLSPMQPAHRLVMEASERLGLSLRIVGGIEDLPSMLELCEQGVGATILSTFAASRAVQRPGLVALPIAESGLERHVRIAMAPEAGWSEAVLVGESLLARLLAEAVKKS